MHSRLIAIGILLLGGALLWLVAWRFEEPSAERPKQIETSPAEAEPVARPELRSSKLADEIARLAKAQATQLPTAVVVPVDDDVEPDDPGSNPDPEGVPVSPRERGSGPLGPLFKRWRSEQHDEEASEAISAKFESALGEANKLSRVVECRETLCRVEFGASTLAEFEPLREVEPTDELRMMFDEWPYASEEGVSYVVYVGRGEEALDDIVEREGSLKELHSTWSTTGEDPSASGTAHAFFEQAFVEHGIAPQDRAVSCSAELCRAKFTFESMTELGALNRLEEDGKDVDVTLGPPVRTEAGYSVVLYFHAPS